MRSYYRDVPGVPTEREVIAGGPRTFTGQQPHGVIFCHGSGDLAQDPFRDQNYLFRLASEFATVHAGDFANNSWGNPTGISRVRAAIQDLRTNWGVEGPVALVGMSMGHALACSYALAYPDDVACIAGAIPLVSFQSAITIGMGAAINAAFPPAYSAQTHGPTHDPMLMNLPTDIPHHIWCATSDTFTPIDVAEAYVAAHPEVQLTNLGAWGHTDNAVTIASPAIAAFVKEHLGA